MKSHLVRGSYQLILIKLLNAIWSFHHTDCVDAESILRDHEIYLEILVPLALLIGEEFQQTDILYSKMSPYGIFK